MHEFVPRKPFSCLAATNILNPQLYVKNSSLQFFSIPQCTFTKLLAILNAGNQHVMVLKVSWIKILFIKLTNSSKHSLMLAKTGIEMHLMHEFMPLEPFLGFLQQKLIFWVFSHHFGALKHPLGFAPHTLRLKLVFRAISLTYPTRCENQYRCQKTTNGFGGGNHPKHEF